METIMSGGNVHLRFRLKRRKGNINQNMGDVYEEKISEFVGLLGEIFKIDLIREKCKRSSIINSFLLLFLISVSERKSTKVFHNEI